MTTTNLNNFDKNGIALRDVRIKVYQFDEQDKEYIGTQHEHVVEGTGIPANSTLIKAGIDKDGYTQVFDEKSQIWSYVKDYRYHDVYNTQTKQKEAIRYIGDLEDHHTLIAPPSTFHEYKDGEWIISEAARAEKERLEAEELRVQKQQRLNEITKEIEMLERFERSADEEAKLQSLIAESQEIYRYLNPPIDEAEAESDIE